MIVLEAARIINMSEVAWWVGAIIGLATLTTIITVPLRKVMKQYAKMCSATSESREDRQRLNRDVSAIKKAVLAQTKVDINKICDRAIQRGFILPKEIEEVEILYEPYLLLDGNGPVASKIASVRRLPVRAKGDTHD